MVINPRRDAQIYASYANEHQAVLTHIFETHRHEDYVIGSLELQHLVPSAKIGHSKETAFEYGNFNIADEDEFERLLKDPRYFAIDVRTLDDFSLGHISSSINLPLEALGQIAGWVLEYAVELLLILENDEQVGYVRNLLFRLGFDNVFGILEGGIKQWTSAG